MRAPRYENRVNFDSDSKSSRFRPPHKTKPIMIPTVIKSTPIPHTDITATSTTYTTTKSISMPTLKSCHFRVVLLCVVYIPVLGTCSCDTSATLSFSSSTRRRFYPQRSSGQAVVTCVFPSHGYVPLIFIAHRVQHSHCSSILIECC